MKIAFQGEPGAYSEQALYNHFGRTTETLPCETFDLVFAAVEENQVDAGLIAIENSLAGSIHQNYDLLLRHQLSITGEHFLRVHHCLIGLPGVRKDEIKRVISHPQALGQCAGYIRALPGVKPEPVFDTAGSVKIMRDAGERTTAAIASRRAAELYGMNIIEEGIEDNQENYTRFLAISRAPVAPATDAKTSIVFSLKNQPGALFKAMSVFALRDIDLTKIESRPMVGKPWEYMFYIDLIGSIDEEHVKKALDHLDEYALMLRVLGCYPRHRPE